MRKGLKKECTSKWRSKRMSLVWIENDSFKKERTVVASLIFLYAIKHIYEWRKVEFRRYQNWEDFSPQDFTKRAFKVLSHTRGKKESVG